MIFRFSIILGFLALPFLISAQQLEKFSEDPATFLKELEGFLTASKNPKMEELYKAFEKSYKGGAFSADEITRIRQTCDKMLGQRMTANPYFSAYFQGLSLVKKTELAESRFKNWHDVLDGMIGGIENRKMKPIEEFLDFSYGFFEKNALRKSDLGTTWVARASRYDLVLEDKKPIVKYDKLDLIAVRGKDSIVIKSTAGVYSPVDEIWKGKGGTVSWERLGLKDVYAELSEYEFESKKSLYEVKSAKLHYPLYFGQTPIEGKFEDKLITQNEATEGSYPRFESNERVLEIKNIGEGVRFKGGFRLQGTTVYGFGNSKEKAELKIFNKKNELIYKGQSQLFSIKQEERIVGEGVESSVYFGKDSIYHPSVNVRFELKKKELQLTRGKRGSDRNPFYNSMHQINIDAELIDYQVQNDSIYIGRRNVGMSKSAASTTFESLKFFNENDYSRLQNISTTNPISIMKVAYQETGEKTIKAESLAKRLNPKFSVENINSLLYDLVAKGFINYNADEGIVEMKDKVLHYAEASQKKVDYDNLRITSETNETNAVFDLKDNSISVNGVKNIELSQSQKVGLVPYGDNIRMKTNRDIDFDGRLYAGFGLFDGKGFHFDYNKFHVSLDSVRYFDMYLPTGKVDKSGAPEAYSIASRIEHLGGVLLVDAPANKSGRESIEMFPSIESKRNCFVFYDYKKTQGGAYTRDSFYFKLNPFSFNSLDKFTKDALKFKGKMMSSKIFPDFDETLVLREDTSLGFVTRTPKEGYPNYQGKGKYIGSIDLSNKGMIGQGTLSYLGASIDSDDLIFKPKQLTGSAERFDLEEERNGEVPHPQVRGFDVTLDWRPYKDSMYVDSKEAPFELFKEGRHTLKGTLILTPGGLKGKGLFDWDKASMTSKLLAFGAYSVKSDTSDLKIKALDADAIALSTTNLNADIDFDKQTGKFKANAEVLTTTLPYNQYVTTFNEFDWDMAKETVTFRAVEGKSGGFTSIHPEQDSLHFTGKAALYDLKTNLLKVGGVPYIVSSDAYIYTETGDIEVAAGGVIGELKNAKIVADTTSKYHVINRATVNVLGRKEYRAKGFYEYNIGDKKQEIDFAEIVGTRVGEGNHATKRSVTRAKGEIHERSNFYIDHKTKFQGTISLSAEKPKLGFQGFAQLDADKHPYKTWFSVNFEGDKNDLAIAYGIPLNPEGEQVFTGVFLSKETATCYPRVMNSLFFRKDRPIMAVQGVMQYDEKADRFIFMDSLRAISGNTIPRGNQLIFDNKTAKIEMDGKFSLGSGLKNVSVEATGTLKTAFGDMVVDSTLGTSSMKSAMDIEAMMGLRFPIPSNLLKIIVADFKSSTFDASPIVYAKDIPYYRKAVWQLFPESPEMQSAIDGIALGSLDLPKKANTYTTLFDKVPLAWDTDYQSFVSTKSKIGLVSMDGEMVNTIINAYIEVKMPTNDDDRLYVYLKSPSQMYYFIGYKQGILNLVSNNPSFMENLLKIKEKDRIIKLPNGEQFEIQPVEESTASAFLGRIEAVKKE